MKHRGRIKIVGRRIDLLHTDLKATFRRVRREQAEQAKQVIPINRRRAAAK